MWEQVSAVTRCVVFVFQLVTSGPCCLDPTSTMTSTASDTRPSSLTGNPPQTERNMTAGEKKNVNVQTGQTADECYADVLL